MTHASAILAQLFVERIDIPAAVRLWMLVPLAMAIGVVYKAIRCERPAEIPIAAALVCVKIIVGMLAIGAAVLIVFTVLA